MKLLLTTFTALCLAAVGGDREEGLKLYRAGRYAEAQAAFERALVDDPGSAELQWNLALAAWRAGDLVTAEIAAEKYAAAFEGAAEDRHRGMLGAVRYAEAEQLEREADAAQAAPPATAAPGPDDAPPADPAPLLEQAVQKAFQSRNHFVRAIRANPTAELVRNGERAVRKLEELKQKLEDLLKQRQPQQQGDDGDEQGDDQQQDKDQQGSEGQQGDQQKQEPEQGQEGSQEQRGEEQGDPSQQPPSGEGEPPETPEPQPSESQEQQGEAAPPPEQPPAAGEEGAEPDPAAEAGEPEEKMELPEPDQGKPRADAPGEGGEDLELTPEQAKRLLDRLKAMEKQMKQARARARAGRRPVERDW